MKVTVKGQGPVTLGQGDFVAAGGEGSIYTKNGVAYKVYTDPARMLPVGKIGELGAITDKNVIKPENILLDNKAAPIGYTMRFVAGTLALCTIFPRAFREREGLDHPKMLGLIRDLQQHIENIHKAGILVVDLNEMNFLVAKALTEVYAIDVDSYQTPGYQATAIMPSVRDWTVKGHDFTELSDWFSFACVAYQMFTGIHPYKGTHPSYSGQDALVNRMKARVSVFDSAVRVPKVVYPMDVIPPVYRDWFKAVLHDGKRLPPPASLVATVVVAAQARVVSSGTTLDIAELFSFGSEVHGYIESSGVAVTWTDNEVFLGTRTVQTGHALRAVGFSPRMNVPMMASVSPDGMLVLTNLANGQERELGVKVDYVMGYGGRIYVKAGDTLMEVELTDMSGTVMGSTSVVANIIPHATRLFEGVAIQSLLGSTYVAVFPKSGQCYEIRVPELDKYRVVDAKFDHKVLMVIGSKNGKYDRLIFEFDEVASAMKQRTLVPDITPTGLNFVVLESGVCASITEEEKLEIFAVGSPKVRVVESDSVGNDMRLVKHGGRVAFINGRKVFSLRLK